MIFVLGVVIGILSVLAAQRSRKFHKDWIVERELEVPIIKAEGPYRTIPMEHVQKWAEDVKLHVQYPSGQWPEIAEVMEDFNLSYPLAMGQMPSFEVQHTTGKIRVRYYTKPEVDRSTGCLAVSQQKKLGN